MLSAAASAAAAASTIAACRRFNAVRNGVLEMEWPSTGSRPQDAVVLLHACVSSLVTGCFINLLAFDVATATESAVENSSGIQFFHCKLSRVVTNS